MIEMVFISGGFLKKIILFSIFLISFSGCSKKDGLAPDVDTAINPVVTSPLNAAQIAGTHYALCAPVSGGVYGTSVDGMSILKSISLNTNLTYSISIYLFTGTVCQAGGTPIFTYSQSGNYSIGSVAATPAGATEMMYTSTSSNLTVYAGSGIGSTWAGYLNSYCPGGPTFSTSATSSGDEGGRTCMNVGSPSFSFPTFPSNGTVFYDTINLDSVSSPTILTTSTAINLFLMGQYSSYPTGTGFNYTF